MKIGQRTREGTWGYEFISPWIISEPNPWMALTSLMVPPVLLMHIFAQRKIARTASAAPGWSNWRRCGSHWC